MRDQREKTKQKKKDECVECDEEGVCEPVECEALLDKARG